MEKDAIREQPERENVTEGSVWKGRQGPSGRAAPVALCPLQQTSSLWSCHSFLALASGSLPGKPTPSLPGGGVNDLSLPTVGGQLCPLLPRTEAQASQAPQTPALRLVLCVLPLGADGRGFNVKKADLFDASTLGKSDHILPKSATGRLPFPRVVSRAPSVQPLLPHPRLSPALLHVLWLCPLSEVTLSPPPSPRAESPSPK